MILESVPNFSEGRRQDVLDKIAETFRAVSGVRLLDVDSNADHNRSVFTLVGPPAPLKIAAVAGVKRAMELIDLNTHRGEHPRMGACDVLPFIPIRDAELSDCIEIARSVGETIGALGLPVFLYEAASYRTDRRNLPDIRNKQQFEGLRERIGTDPYFSPDFGPKKIHPKAGAIAIGARQPLIAYNIDLESEDLALAKSIAKKIRERDGGLPGIRALGMSIAERKCAQVSMNVCDYTRTSLKTVYDRVTELAAEKGVTIRSSEIVGMLPAAALGPGWIEILKLQGFSTDQIIENRL